MVGLMLDSWFSDSYPSLLYTTPPPIWSLQGSCYILDVIRFWRNAMYMYISRTKNLLLSQHGTPVQQRKTMTSLWCHKIHPKGKDRVLFSKWSGVAMNRIKPNYRTACSVPKTCALNYLPSPQSAPRERGMEKAVQHRLRLWTNCHVNSAGDLETMPWFLVPKYHAKLLLWASWLSQRLL